MFGEIVMLKIILISVVLSVVLSSVITIFAMRIVSDVITLFVSRTEERFDKKLEIYKQLCIGIARKLRTFYNNIANFDLLSR